jgi:Peptidase family M28
MLDGVSAGRSIQPIVAGALLVTTLASGCDDQAGSREAAPASVSTPAAVEPPGVEPPRVEPPPKAVPTKEAAIVPPPAAPGSLPESVLQRITPQGLRAHVELLADDRLRGRPTPSPQLDEAAQYLRAQLRGHGLVAPPGAPEHEQRFECGGPERPGLASNVIALLPGREPALASQTVMVSAHYDHIGEAESGDDIVFNGANDDASGTAAVLAIAEVLAAARPRRSVLFVAFCGEELGLRGSYHFAEAPVRPLADIVAHVNLEMLGRPGPADPPVAWIPGRARSQLGEWLAAANPGASAVQFLDGHDIGPEEGAAFNRADNYPLALRGVVAHTVAAGTIDELYHSPDDESDALDYERMAVIVRAVARGVHRLAEHDGQPAWIDPPL